MGLSVLAIIIDEFRRSGLTVVKRLTRALNGGRSKITVGHRTAIIANYFSPLSRAFDTLSNKLHPSTFL